MWLVQVVLITFLLLPFRVSSPIVDESPTAALPSAQADEVATITGRVVSDVDGVPVSNVKIILIDPDNTDEQSSVALTDVSGYYTVTQPISHTWIIRFDPPSAITPYPNILFIPEYYNNTYDLEAATPITAEVGTTTSNINASLAHRGQIFGRVTDATDDMPIENVVVTAFEAESGNGLSPVATDHSGAYTITTYSPGTYKLRFDPPYTSSYALEYYNNKTSLGKAQSVIVEEGRDLHVDVSLETGGIITGIVTSNWLGKLIEFPEVLALNENGEQVQLGSRLARTPWGGTVVEPPGYYTIPNLPEGSYELKFMAENHQAFRYTTSVEVIAGEKTTNIDAKLALAPQVTSIATSAAAPGIILLAFQNIPTPLITLDGGISWQPAPTSPWIADEAIFTYPDHFAVQNFTANIAPRELSGEDARLLINVGTSQFAPDSLRPGIYRSGDNGQSWADAEIDSPLDMDECSSATFSTPMTTMHATDHFYLIYTCDSSHRLLRSANRGITWQDITNQDSSTLQLYNGASVMPSPHVADLLYLLNGRVAEELKQWYKSTNSGQDWQAVDFPLDSLVFDTQDAATLYGWAPITNETPDRIGKRSTDGGATWQDWTDPCTYRVPQGVELPQLLAHPTISGMLFIRCNNGDTDGLFRSKDGGDTWQRITQANGDLLTADLGTPGRILWAKDDGLWASTDNGDTWQVILQNYRLSASALYLPTLSSEN